MSDLWSNSDGGNQGQQNNNAGGGGFKPAIDPRMLE